MEDLIKRSDAIEAIKGNSYLDDDYIEINGYGAIEDIRTLPPADRPSGEWVERGVFHNAEDDPIIEDWQSARCSVCHRYHTTPYMYYFDNYNFCPMCGARMKGADDER